MQVESLATRTPVKLVEGFLDRLFERRTMVSGWPSIVGHSWTYQAHFGAQKPHHSHSHFEVQACNRCSLGLVPVCTPHPSDQVLDEHMDPLALERVDDTDHLLARLGLEWDHTRQDCMELDRGWKHMPDHCMLGHCMLG